VTSFLQSHPGGVQSILRVAGKDATEDFDPIHPPGTLEEHTSSLKYVGEFDISTLPNLPKKPSPRSDGQAPDASTPHAQFVPSTVEQCLNIDEIEALATRKLSRRAWAYYFSAGDDLFSKSYNNKIYQKIFLRPRVFVDVTHCDLSTTLLGTIPVSLPIFVSPAAQARLAHPSGEGGIAQACAKHGALQIISNNASLTPEQIVAASPNTTFGWQVYVQQDRAQTEAMFARIRKLSQIKFVVLTLDAPVPGKREHDEQLAFARAEEEGEMAGNEDVVKAAAKSGGVGKAMFAGTAMDLTWKSTLPWLKTQVGGLPVVLKGIQTHEDAAIAASYAPLIKGVILSNHGGRAADTAPPAIHTLLEIRKFAPEVFGKIDVWVDGGIKRGTDVVKALSLGAKAVGIGRGPLFGLGAGGEKGVERVFEILRAETETTFKLLGCGKVEELGVHCVSDLLPS
jgi:L-lactate dehydrogenase (cytochrome)